MEIENQNNIKTLIDLISPTTLMTIKYNEVEIKSFGPNNNGLFSGFIYKKNIETNEIIALISTDFIFETEQLAIDFMTNFVQLIKSPDMPDYYI